MKKLLYRFHLPLVYSVVMTGITILRDLAWHGNPRWLGNGVFFVVCFLTSALVSEVMGLVLPTKLNNKPEQQEAPKK